MGGLVNYKSVTALKCDRMVTHSCDPTHSREEFERVVGDMVNPHLVDHNSEPWCIYPRQATNSEALSGGDSGKVGKDGGDRAHVDVKTMSRSGQHMGFLHLAYDLCTELLGDCYEIWIYL